MNRPSQLLYLTYGEYNPTAPWGGFHITICGKNFKKPISETLNTEFYKRGNSWRFSKSPNYRIEKWNNDIWTIVIESQTIDALSQDLIRLGFDSVKGPSKGTPWHVSLLGLNEEQAKHKAYELVQSDRRPSWFLTVCEENNGNYTWFRPL